MKKVKYIFSHIFCENDKIKEGRANPKFQEKTQSARQGKFFSSFHGKLDIYYMVKQEIAKNGTG